GGGLRASGCAVRRVLIGSVAGCGLRCALPGGRQRLAVRPGRGVPLLPRGAVPAALLLGLLRDSWHAGAPRPADGLAGGPGGRGAAREGGRRGAAAAPLLGQGGRGELARFVREVAVGDRDRPLAGDVLPRRGAVPGGRGVLEVPLTGGAR